MSKFIYRNFADNKILEVDNYSCILQPQQRSFKSLYSNEAATGALKALEAVNNILDLLEISTRDILTSNR